MGSSKGPITGLVAAVLTPFGPDGNLNLAVVEKQAQLLIETGVSGVFVCGTTGECHSLTVDERVQLTQRWVQVAKGKLAVIAHVGHNCIKDARLLATRAQVAGCDAIAAMSPFFFKPETAGELADYLGLIAAAAPGLPFYYYEIPSMTGVHVPAVEVIRAAANTVPTFRGVKFTNKDLMAYQECRAACEARFDILFGHDEMLLPALAVGAQGAIGASYNFSAAIYNKIIQAFAANDLATAQANQLLAVRLIRALIPFGIARAGKAIMLGMGIDCGPVRSPLKVVSAEETRRILAVMRELPAFPRKLTDPT